MRTVVNGHSTRGGYAARSDVPKTDAPKRTRRVTEMKCQRRLFLRLLGGASNDDRH
jgi:hypothetical protein